MLTQASKAMLQRLVKIGTIVLAIAALVTPFVFARASYGLQEAMNAANKNGEDKVLPTFEGKSLPEVIGTVVQSMLALLGIVFFGIILYSGFNWMIAMGNSEKVDKAKLMIESALIGLVIIILAYALTRFIFTFFETGSMPV